MTLNVPPPRRNAAALAAATRPRRPRRILGHVLAVDGQHATVDVAGDTRTNIHIPQQCRDVQVGDTVELTGRPMTVTSILTWHE